MRNPLQGLFRLPDTKNKELHAPDAANLLAGLKKEGVVLGVGVAFLIFGFLPLPDIASLVFFITACLVSGYPAFLTALRGIVRGRIFDENVLLTIAMAGAFCIGHSAEGAVIILLHRAGTLLEGLTVTRARRLVAVLLEPRADRAAVLRDGLEVSCPADEILPGESITVKPGECVPLDGIVLSGESAVDMSPLTGESVPVMKREGDPILAGSVNKSAALMIEVTARWDESTLSKITALTENAAKSKSPIERRITGFAGKYTPVACLAALLVAVLPPLILKDPFPGWIYRALILLIVFRPCALVFSVPLAFSGGICGASRKGVLIKSGESLESLAKAHVIAFDKTGTLTKGKFSVTSIQPAEGFSEQELLMLAAGAEMVSTHPIALSIKNAAGLPANLAPKGDYEELAGLGIAWKMGDQVVLAGNAGLMEQYGIDFAPVDNMGTVVYVAAGGFFSGSIIISDPLKEDAARTIFLLKEIGIEKTALLTGDRRPTAEAVASALDMDIVYSDLLPFQKAEQMASIRRDLPKGRTAAFVGDSVNDASVLAAADVGIAMGTDVDTIIQAADIMLMTDEPVKLVSAVKIARHTYRIALQNAIAALIVKALILILAVTGLSSMWLAVLADIGVTVLLICNALRALYAK